MQPLYFAHGNGFPSLCYHKLLTALSADFQILYIEQVGHDPNYPVTNNWQFLVKEILADLLSKATEPVVGVGHSLGGILLFLAAIQQPQLFKSLILLDAPLLGFGKSYVIKWAKLLGWMGRFTPTDKARMRRSQWPDAETAIQDFQKKALFQYFDPDCLRDYVQYGLQATDDGLILRFDRTIESQIYKTLPDNLVKYRGQLTVPAGIIYGAESHVITFIERATMARYYQVKPQKVPGTHLFPFEYPLIAAEAISKMAQQLDRLSDEG